MTRFSAHPCGVDPPRVELVVPSLATDPQEPREHAHLLTVGQALALRDALDRAAESADPFRYRAMDDDVYFRAAGPLAIAMEALEKVRAALVRR